MLSSNPWRTHASLMACVDAAAARPMRSVSAPLLCSHVLGVGDDVECMIALLGSIAVGSRTFHKNLHIMLSSTPARKHKI